jgi:hypothetical protein
MRGEPTILRNLSNRSPAPGSAVPISKAADRIDDGGYARARQAFSQLPATAGVEGLRAGPHRHRHKEASRC